MNQFNFNDNGFDEIFKQLRDSNKISETSTNVGSINPGLLPIQIYSVSRDAVKPIQNALIRGYMPVEIQINEKPKQSGSSIINIVFIGAFIFLIYSLYNHFKTEVKRKTDVSYYLESAKAQHLIAEEL